MSGAVGMRSYEMGTGNNIDHTTFIEALERIIIGIYTAKVLELQLNHEKQVAAARQAIEDRATAERQAIQRDIDELRAEVAALKQARQVSG